MMAPSLSLRLFANVRRPKSDVEIAGCISEIGVPFTPDDLLRPQPALVQRVFEWLAELLMNTTRETVDPAMREAAKDVCGEELMDIVPAETRNLMGFYASLRKLFVEVSCVPARSPTMSRPPARTLMRFDR